MITITYIKQVSLPGQKIKYIWNNRVLTAQLLQNEEVIKEEVFDLSVLNDGDELESVETDNFSFSPLINAKNINNNLEVTLLYWYEGEEPTLEDEVIEEG